MIYEVKSNEGLSEFFTCKATALYTFGDLYVRLKGTREGLTRVYHRECFKLDNNVIYEYIEHDIKSL